MVPRGMLMPGDEVHLADFEGRTRHGQAVPARLVLRNAIAEGRVLEAHHVVEP